MTKHLKLDEQRIKILLNSLRNCAFRKGEYPVIQEMLLELEKLEKQGDAGTCPVHGDHPDPDKCFDCFCISKERGARQ